ncbi:S-norcoclaurine synthase 1 [Hibiscus syriacus]|uniref:S-norcoclaurine synthase 1 n=1 Tax=Hibiscus syriacus TaxID=106335 RepID=A0A6A2WH46_HIBSY|nr:S-norcoclaurine synthase 1 [Hibiscus syriacus]
METKVLQFGSLPVENVQALASKNLKNVPSRYIRPEVKLDVVSVDESLQVPVIDMSKLDDDDDDDEREKFHLVCKDWGFFQLLWMSEALMNHGVEDEVIEKMKMDTQDFFNLPLEGKMACAQIPNHIEGYGQAFVVSEEQKLDWEDMLFLFALPVPLRTMRFWPTNPPSFRLQIKRNEKWVPVKLMPGAFIINIGDMLEILSNGEYKSIEHRAVVNPAKEQLSIAAFRNPKNGTQIGPLPDLVMTNKALYRTLPLEEFLRLKMTRKLDGKCMIKKMML